MVNSVSNVTNAVQNAAYYNDLWLRVGTGLHYIDLSRVRFLVDSIKEYLEVGHLNILDFGCGRGWMAPFLSSVGTVTGIDFAPEGIRFARENYGEHATFFLADPDSPVLGLTNDIKYDVVICSEVIEHVVSHEALLRQIAHVLRPGGWCMLTTPNGNVWAEFNQDERYKGQQQPIENWVTTGQLANLFRQTGFRLMRHEGLSLYEFRAGRFGWLQQPLLERFSRRAGLYHHYARLIRPFALYQVVVAQKPA